MSLLQSDFPFSSVFHDLGTLGWAAVLIFLWVILRDLNRIRSEMVTRDSLTIALSGMREELGRWAEQRFQSKYEAARVSNGHTKDIEALRRRITDCEGEGDSH